jgi:microcystin degradation protein MlrC
MTLLTASAAARLVGRKSESSIRQAIKAGRLAAVRVHLGGRWVWQIKPEDVEAWAATAKRGWQKGRPRKVVVPQGDL